MRRTHKLTTTAALASGGLLLSVGAAPAVVAKDADAGRESSRHGWGHGHHRGFDLADEVSPRKVMRRLEDLQELSDDNGGNRAVGTAGYEASGAYVERVLRKAGYRTERQYFEAEQFTVDEFSLEVPGVPLEAVVMSYSSSTPEGGVSGDLVAPAVAQGCDAAAWEGVDAAGDIAVVSRGTCPFAAKALAAGEAGAAGVIVYNNEAGPLNGTLGATDPATAPAVGVTQEEGAALLDAMAAGTVTASLEIQAQVETVETFNVLAETRGGDEDDVVMLGAHLDGVEEGPGINDNGSGSAAILETAVQLAEATGMDRRGEHRGHHRSRGRGHDRGHGHGNGHGHGKKRLELDSKVRFAWWGAEEIGLVGSTHYVDDLVANDPEGLAAISSYLNFDMIGSPNYTVGVYDADESTFEAPVAVPEGSAELEAVFTDYFDAEEQPWVDSEYSGRSDYQAFIENGVPAGGLFSGADDIKTEEEAAIFGGTAGQALDPNYHSAEDDIDNVSFEALEIFVPAIAHATQELAEEERGRH